MKWFVVLLIIIPTAFSLDYAKKLDFSKDEHILQSNDKFYSFKLHMVQKFLLSGHCIEKNKLCMAKDVLFKKLKPKKDIPLNGGVNLGTIVCVKYLSGNLVTMRNNSGHQLSICEFPDRSMISTGILEKLLLD